MLKKMFLLGMVVALVMALTVPAWAAESGKINLNTATAKELSQLKRIGPKYAERIVKYREENGPFKTTEEIVNVPGIGTKTWKLNKDLIVVE